MTGGLFQSTPPRGWRRDCSLLYDRTFYFNPLHREGGDETYICFLRRRTISIHSTARVETVQYWKIIWNRCDFNPLHREGGDTALLANAKAFVTFQSTPPRGWRLVCPLPGRHNGYFNPLHREGGDWRHRISFRYHGNFNPLHREGGDFQVPVQFRTINVFQSTPPRGWRL